MRRKAERCDIYWPRSHQPLMNRTRRKHVSDRRRCGRLCCIIIVSVNCAIWQSVRVNLFTLLATIIITTPSKLAWLLRHCPRCWMAFRKSLPRCTPRRTLTLYIGLSNEPLYGSGKWEYRYIGFHVALPLGCGAAYCPCVLSGHNSKNFSR